MRTQTLTLEIKEETLREQLKALCHASKNLYNSALYEIRQHFFKTEKYLSYPAVDKLLKGTNENYGFLYSQVSQQTLKYVDRSMKSFFGLLKAKKQGKFDEKVNLPKYLDKEGFFPLIVPSQHIKFKPGKFKLLQSKTTSKIWGEIWLPFPPNLDPATIAEIRIVPKYDAQIFEIHYVSGSEKISVDLDYSLGLGIDLGVDNLMTCVASTGDSFIIDGKRLKALNQWYNKENSRLQSIQDLLGLGRSKRQVALTMKRNNQVRDYINKAAKRVINYCLENGIGNIVIGHNERWKQGSNMSKASNQKFTAIPHSRLVKRIQELGEMFGILVTVTEESYTSKSSFLDGDNLPVYDKNEPKKHKFSGRRIITKLYKTAKGWLVNADANGAANILRKGNVNSKLRLDLSGVCRGTLDSPVRYSIT